MLIWMTCVLQNTEPSSFLVLNAKKSGSKREEKWQLIDLARWKRKRWDLRLANQRARLRAVNDGENEDAEPDLYRNFSFTFRNQIWLIVKLIRCLRAWMFAPLRHRFGGNILSTVLLFEDLVSFQVYVTNFVPSLPASTLTTSKHVWGQPFSSLRGNNNKTKQKETNKQKREKWQLF